MVCVRCRVSGRVQGVWYRGTTQQRARDLGLTGSAINLPDGRVEVIACGAEEAVLALQDWLWTGPRLARVTDISCERISLQAPEGFTTG